MYSDKKNRGEQEDLSAIAHGNLEAFERMYFKYYPLLVYFITGLTHDQEVGRDLSQDIFLSLWENRKKLAFVEYFSSYLFKMAKNTVYDYYDRIAVREKYNTEELLKHSFDSFLEEEALFARNLKEMIDKEVDKLSPQRKTIYRLSREEGLSNEDIAVRLQISKRTVENHLTAVLAVLRKTILLFLCILSGFD